MNPSPYGLHASPLYPAAQYQAGIAALEDGRTEEAAAILSRLADRTDVTGTLARFYLGRARLQLGLSELRARRFRTAAEHLQAAAALNPGDGDLSNYLAACYVGQNRFDLAALEYEKQVDRGSTSDLAAVRLALATWKQGQLDHAIEILHAASRTRPASAELHFQLGLLHAAADRYDAALAELQTASRLEPLNPEIRQHLGLTLAATGNMPAACEHLRAAHELRPKDAYLALQLTYAARAVAEEGGAPSLDIRTGTANPVDRRAIERLAEIVVGEPDFVEAFLALPESRVDSEIFTLLAATLEWALERHPEFADLHYHCSRVYQRLRRPQAAIEAARRAVRANPEYVEALILLGRLYADTDRAQEAIERLETAIRHGGDWPDVHYLLGRLFYRRGDRDRARRSFERALQLNAGYREARRALEELAA